MHRNGNLAGLSPLQYIDRMWVCVATPPHASHSLEKCVPVVGEDSAVLNIEAPTFLRTPIALGSRVPELLTTFAMWLARSPTAAFFFPRTGPLVTLKTTLVESEGATAQGVLAKATS